LSPDQLSRRSRATVDVGAQRRAVGPDTQARPSSPEMKPVPAGSARLTALHSSYRPNLSIWMVRVRIGAWNPESLADRNLAHGDPDRTIPTSEAQLLFASANEPKRLLIIPGAGHVPFGSAGETIFESSRGVHARST